MCRGGWDPPPHRQEPAQGNQHSAGLGKAAGCRLLWEHVAALKCLLGCGGWSELCLAREKALQPGLLPALAPALTFLPGSLLCRFMSTWLEETLLLLSGLSTKA